MLRRLNDMPARQTPKAPAALPAGLLDGLRCLIALGRQRALRAPVLLYSAHLFTAKYKLVLPSEEEPPTLLERERSELLAQQGTS